MYLIIQKPVISIYKRITRGNRNLFLYFLKTMFLIFLLLFSLTALSSCSRISPDFYTLEIIIGQENTEINRGYITVQGEGIGSADEALEVRDEDSFCLERGTIVTLQAYPLEDYKFSRWNINGQDAGIEDKISLEMTENKTVRAYFGHPDSAEITAEISLKHSYPFSPLDNFESLEPAPGPTVNVAARLSTDLNKTKEQPEVQEIIVAFTRDTDLTDKKISLQSQGYQITDSSREGNYLLIKLDSLPELSTPISSGYSDNQLQKDDDISWHIKNNQDQLQQLIQQFENQPEVRYAEPNYSYQIASIKYPDDTYYSYQWNYPQIRLPQAWNSITGSESVRIAVLDTGIDSEHPDLAGQIVENDGYNFTDDGDSDDFSDKAGHGTHVAGIIAAATNNNQGVAGTIWQSSLVPVKVMSNSSGRWNDIAKGIRYAAGLLEDTEISEPVDIINLSLGGEGGSNAVEEAVQDASQAGVILVAAAGNDADDFLLYPAAYDEVISVGAVDYNYPEEPKLAHYSNYSFELDILAPGGDMKVDSSDRGVNDGILSTYLTDVDSEEDFSKYSFLEGTSMAAPHISGVIGLMLSHGVPRDSEKIRNILKNTSLELTTLSDDNDDIDIGDTGLVNAYWALHQPEKISVTLKHKVEGEFQQYKKENLPLRGGNTAFVDLPSGEYLFQVHLDVQNTGNIDPGDYFLESDPVLIGVEESIKIDLNLIERE